MSLVPFEGTEIENAFCQTAVDIFNMGSVEQCDKIHSVLCDTGQCGMLDSYRHSEDEGTLILQDVCNCLPIHTALHPRTLESSATLLCKPQVLCGSLLPLSTWS
jgi:hypothetical protein